MKMPVATQSDTKNKTLVLGASPHSWRYSHFAVKKLLENGHAVIPLGNQKDTIADIPILVEKPFRNDVHTVTIYLRPDLQLQYEDYILSLHPHRIIFNPGAGNARLARRARQKGIEVIFGCTLVMLSTGAY